MDQTRTPEFFIDGMRKLVLLWEKCIERQGDYVKKISMPICS